MNKGRLSLSYRLQIIALVVVMVCVSALNIFNIYFDKTVKIYIGYQSVTAQTWSALIMKNRGTLICLRWLAYSVGFFFGELYK